MPGSPSMADRCARARDECGERGRRRPLLTARSTNCSTSGRRCSTPRRRSRARTRVARWPPPSAPIFSSSPRNRPTPPTRAGSSRSSARPYPAGRVLAREERHLRAAEAWASGDLHRGQAPAPGHRPRASARCPRAGGRPQIDFFSGDALALRDRIAEALGAWPSDHPHYGLLLGMLSFGLEEAGEYERARRRARRAVGETGGTSGASTPSPS